MKKICFIGLGGYSVFMSVDHFNQIGETVSANSFYAEPGGKGYNQAVAAARLGACATFIGAFGDDDSAKMCIDFLKAEKVNPVVIYKEQNTAYACILTDNVGENRVTVFGGAASVLNGDDVYNAEAEIKDSAMLVLQNEVNISANIAALDLADKYNIPVIINPAPADGFEEHLLKRAYLITPNEHEAKTLFGDDWRQGIISSGIQRAVVTLGSQGAEVYENGVFKKIPAVQTKAVDTTGAGDCFTAALAVRILRGEGLVDAASFAAKAASLAVSRRFAVKAMPKLEEM